MTETSLVYRDNNFLKLKVHGEFRTLVPSNYFLLQDSGCHEQLVTAISRLQNTLGKKTTTTKKNHGSLDYSEVAVTDIPAFF